MPSSDDPDLRGARRLFGAFAVALFAGPAFGQTATGAEDVLYVTGLRPTPPSEAAASVTVLTLTDLKVRDAPYLADALRAAPGVSVSRSGARGGLTQVRMRGAEANHTLVFLDGVEVSDPVTGETDFGLWSGAGVGRVEILRGEQSALYGSDAIGGVILARSDFTPGVSLDAEAGAFGTKRIDGRAGVADGAFEGAATVSMFSTSGVDTSGAGGERDGSRAVVAGAAAAIDLGRGWRASALLRFADNRVETDSDVDFDGLPDDTDRVGASDQWILGASVEGKAFGTDHLFRINYGRVAREDFADGAFSGETLGERMKFVYSPSISTALGGGRIALSGLVDYEAEDYRRAAIDTTFGDPNQRQSFHTLGLAAEARASFGRLLVAGSVRRDDNEGLFQDATSWRASAQYRIADGGRFRISAGAGVKNPTFTELFGFFPARFTGDPDLAPERSRSLELGYDQTIGRASFSVGWFRAELRNEIFTRFNSDFTSSPANRTGTSDREGVEAQARAELGGGFSVSGAYSQFGSRDDAGDREIRTPRHTASAALAWRAPADPRWRAAAAVDYVGRQDDFFFTFPAQRVTLESYVLVSATASLPLTKRLSATVRGENLLDADVVDVFGFAQTGRAVFAGVSIR